MLPIKKLFFTYSSLHNDDSTHRTHTNVDFITTLVSCEFQWPLILFKRRSVLWMELKLLAIHYFPDTFL